MTYVWIALGVLLAAIASLGAFVAHVRFWVRRYTVPMDYALLERIETEDGAAIELRRVPPAFVEGEPEAFVRSGLPPLLLVHGLGANHRNNDVHPACSIARHLAARGIDVWLVTLRSGLVDLGRDQRRATRLASMVNHDLPLAVRTVRERTGRDRIDILGFSMGGILVLAAVARSIPLDWLRRAVLVGAPATVEPRIPFLRLLAKLPSWLVPRVPLRLLCRAVAFGGDWLVTPIHHIIFNPRNSAKGLAAVAMVNAIEDLPGRLVADLLRAAATKRIEVGGVPMLDGLATVELPVAFFAGERDNLAPPSSVRAGFDAWGAARHDVRKSLVVLGREHGCAADYGHGDLAIGRDLEHDLFDPIAMFLAEKDADPTV